jgi:hypothetical protein
MLKSVALWSCLFGLAIAFGGGKAAAQSTAPSYTLPAWLSQAGEHWVSYYGGSYIDTSSAKKVFDSELGRDVIEYWTVTDMLSDELAAHFARDQHNLILLKKYLDCKSEAIALVSEADRNIDGFPATFRPDHESDRTLEDREYESIAPGDPDKSIAQTMCGQLSR